MPGPERTESAVTHDIAAALETGVPLEESNDGRIVVAAADIRSALLAGGGRGSPTGLKLRHCDVVGRLDLSNMNVDVPMAFEDCVFDSPIAFESADLRSLTLLRCSVPGISGNGVRMRADLFLDQCTIAAALPSLGSTHHTAAIWLCEAELGGRLLCRGTTIDGLGGRSVQADRMKIGANLRVNGQCCVLGGGHRKSSLMATL